MRLLKYINHIMLAALLVSFGYFCYIADNAAGQQFVERNNIRIGLAQGLPEIQFAVQGNYVITSGYNDKVVTHAVTGGNYTVQRINGEKDTIRLYQNDTLLGVYTGPIVVQKASQEMLVLNGTGAVAKKTSGQGLACIDSSGSITPLASNISDLKVLAAGGYVTPQTSDQSPLVLLKNGGTTKRYRGNLDLRPDDRGITVINDLPLEEYLYSVVPSEMPGSWHNEALKAQAVVARTYALYSSKKHLPQGFDMLATDMDQVYLGYDHEAVQTNRVVDETSGQVLTYQGQFVLAAFHSSSGGYLGNCCDIWVADLPYLRAKEDPYDINNQHYNWSTSKTNDELLRLFNGKGIKITELLDIEELQRDESGSRLIKMLIIGQDQAGNIQRVEVDKGDKIRSLFGLKSSLFDLHKEYDPEGVLTRVTITGSGWGHGLGMSQYGAKGMAEKGYNYQDILKYYYPGAKIELDYGG